MVGYIVWKHESGRDARVMHCPSMGQASSEAAILFQTHRSQVHTIHPSDVKRCRASLGEELYGVLAGLAGIG